MFYEEFYEVLLFNNETVPLGLSTLDFLLLKYVATGIFFFFGADNIDSGVGLISQLFPAFFTTPVFFPFVASEKNI